MGEVLRLEESSTAFKLATSNTGLAIQAVGWALGAGLLRGATPTFTRTLCRRACLASSGACIFVLTMQHHRLQRLLKSELDLAYTFKRSMGDPRPLRDPQVHYVERMPVFGLCHSRRPLVTDMPHSSGAVALMCCSLVYEAPGKWSAQAAAGALKGRALLLPLGVSAVGAVAIQWSSRSLSSEVFELWAYNRECLFGPDDVPAGPPTSP